MKLTILNNILIPEQIQNYYLIPQAIIGLTIEKQALYATKLHYAGRSITLENSYHQTIEASGSEPWHDRTIDALKLLAHSWGEYDQLRASISSSQIIFKKLTLPFADRNKIANIINYELEPYLPFPLHQATITFMITETNAATGSSTIFAAAAPRSLIEEYTLMLQGAGIKNFSFSVDIFDLYSLYCAIPEYNQSPQSALIIAMDAQTTRILYLQNGILHNMRTITKGMAWFAKELADALSLSLPDALEKFMRFGFSVSHEETYNAALTKIAQGYFSEINFTVHSFTNQMQAIDKCLILGEMGNLPNSLPFIEKQIALKCSNFSIDSLIRDNKLTIQQTMRHDHLDIDSLSSAFLTPINQASTLALKGETAADLSLFKKQFLTGGGLALLTIIVLFTHSWREKSRLKSSILESESQITRALKQDDLSTAKNPTRALSEAQEKVASQEEVWFAFSKQTRVSFLKYLERLSTALDRVGLGLTLNKLAFTRRDNDLVLVLQGQVKNFDALKILEQELRNSNLFTYVPSFQTKAFNEEIPLKKNGEDL